MTVRMLSADVSCIAWSRRAAGRRDGTRRSSSRRCGAKKLAHRFRIGVVEVVAFPIRKRAVGEVVIAYAAGNCRRGEVIVAKSSRTPSPRRLAPRSRSGGSRRGDRRAGRGKEIHAVVPPPEAAGEVRHRHHLDCRDPDRAERGELGDRPSQSPWARGADVQLVDHLAADPGPAPLPVGQRNRRGRRPRRPCGPSGWNRTRDQGRRRCRRAGNDSGCRADRFDAAAK